MCTRATWRGVTVCAHMIPDLDALASDVGVGVKLQPFLNPPSGSYQTSTSASIGTHAGGGAIDFDMSGYSDTVARRVETVSRARIKLAYFRRPIAGLWQKHVHVTFPECPDMSSAARDQYPRFQQGLDNLADNAADTGDRTHVAQIMAVFHDRSLYKAPTSGGLTMSDVSDILAALKALQASVDALPERVGYEQVGSTGKSLDTYLLGTNNWTTDTNKKVDALDAKIDALAAAVAALPKA